MKRLLEQLDSIKAIIDTVSPSQIAQNSKAVASGYELYALTYNPIEQVKQLGERLVGEIRKEKPVNGYLSAGFGYGKTATLVYLWHFCQQKKIVAVPPFKFKELGDLMVASYNWMKYALRSQPEIIPQIETLYQKHSFQSQQAKASEIAIKYKLSEEKVIKIVQDLKTDTITTDSVLNFWQESLPIIRSAGFSGLAIFADETQEFLRTEESSSAQIQILSDLVKGMRALGNTPVALILSMPIDPTESAIEEQAGDIIHRMKEQKVSLRLTDVYNSEFPGQLWDFLCQKFLKSKSSGESGAVLVSDQVERLANPEGEKLVHPATIDSLGQLCNRKDLCNGPRAVIEIFKRLVHFAQDNKRSYTPLDLIQDYLTGVVKLYGTEQHRILHTINTLEQLQAVQNHPKGRKVIKLLAIFPNGVSSAVAQEFGLLESLQELAKDGNFYGQHITQPSSDRFALVSLNENQTSITVLDEILNRFRQRWFGDWDDTQKLTKATKIFRDETLLLVLPPSRPGQKANWTWRYKNWKQERYGFYNILNGAPERYNTLFPKRTLVVSVSSQGDELMQFKPPEETHLDWRFYLSYDRMTTNDSQSITAIAGTGNVDFRLQLGRSFEGKYPTAFGLLRKVMAPEHCSACTLLNLSDYIQDWLNQHPEVSKTDLARLEQHRRECHQYALQLLFPAIKAETWVVQGLENLTGTETRLIESVFYQKCRVTFPRYKSFYNCIGSTLRKYKLALGKVSLAIRRGRELYKIPKEEFEKLFETSGSSLPSFLSILKQSGLISDYKIAAKKEENSYLKFTENFLESFIQKVLSNKGTLIQQDSGYGKVNIQEIDYQALWQEVKRCGYLQEEFEETIECLELRRYIESDRQRGIIRQAIAELDSADLNGQLSELKEQVLNLVEAFDENILHELQQRIDDAQAIVNAKPDDEIALDKVQRTILACLEKIEGFCSAKGYALQQDLNNIKIQIENFIRDLNISKVNQQLINNSGLEPCLDEYRKILEKQIYRLEKDCQKLSKSIEVNDTDILILQKQLKRCQQSLKTHENTKVRLLPLVAGLEQWRIIIARAAILRKTINDDPNRLKCYEDDFVDRVVSHFHAHNIDGFKDYELLKAPLEEIEQEINSERQLRRDKFNHLLSRYEDLLGQISLGESYLRELCRFDDDDLEGSYNTLQLIFIQKLQNYSSHKILEWKELEATLLFLFQERQQYVNNLVSEIRVIKEDLVSQINKLSAVINNLEKLETWIIELKSLFQRGTDLHEIFIQLEFDKDENLKDEEKQILNTINQIGESTISISQIRQHTNENQDLWEILKNLYRKGHLEIRLRQRD